MPLTFNCPHCRGAMQDDGTLAGQSLICPHCGGRFDIPGPPQPSVTSRLASVPAYSDAVARRFKESTSILDVFLDFRFEKYLTPLIVRATWVISIVLTIAFMALMFIGMLLSRLPAPGGELQPQAQRHQIAPWASQAISHLGESVSEIITLATMFVMSILFLLWLRVSLEAVIVIFNMAESLRSIDKKVGTQPR